MFRQETISSYETVLVVNGPLNADAVEEFQKKMDDLSAGRSLKITLDLSQAPSINSTALGKILLFRKRLAEQGKTLQIQGCSDGLFKIFKAIKIDKLIHITQ